MIDLIETSTRRTNRHHAPAWVAEARALALLSAPLVLTQLGQMAILTTDIVLLGRFSRLALAAAAIGNTVFFLAWLAGAGPAQAVTAMVAHIVGERPGNRGGVRASLRMGLWAMLIVSAPMMIMLWFGKAILLTLNQDPLLADMAGQFLRPLAFAVPTSLGFLLLRNFTTALGKPRAGLWVMGATIGVNALLGYALIFGHFGAPRLGIVGSGLATALADLFAFAGMIVFVLTSPALRVYRPFRRVFRPVGAKLAEVFKLGVPIGMTMIFEAMLFNAATLVMGTFGATSLAAHQIALNFASVTFMVPLGVGMAATVRVGLAAGAGDSHAARRAGRVARALGVGVGRLCGVAMALLGTRIAGLYLGDRAPADLEIIAMAAVFLKVAAAFQVFDALQVVGAQSLRGLKDARMPMILAGASYWLIGAPVCVFLGLGLNMRGLGVWIGLCVALAVAAAAMVARFGWLTLRRPKTVQGRERGSVSGGPDQAAAPKR